METDYAHCLHPLLTQRVLKQLCEGTSVNVVIPRLGEEVDRFEQDIRKCPLPTETRLLVVNMKVCRHSFHQFLAELVKQLKLTLEQDDLTVILSELENSPLRTVVVLKHFQTLSDNQVHKQFNQDFYDKLNAMKNLERVALLLITPQKYSEILFNIGGEWKTSQLDIAQIECVPELSDDQARYELKQCCPSLSDAQVFQVLEQVKLEEGYDYNLLMCLSKSLQNYSEVSSDIPRFIKQLKRWRKWCQKKELDYRLHKGVGGAKRWWGIAELQQLTSKLWHLFIADPLESLVEIVKEWLNKRKE